MERNLKQKRQLIEDYQKKLKLAQDDAVTKDEKTVSDLEIVSKSVCTLSCSEKAYSRH